MCTTGVSTFYRASRYLSEAASWLERGTLICVNVNRLDSCERLADDVQNASKRCQKQRYLIHDLLAEVQAITQRHVRKFVVL